MFLYCTSLVIILHSIHFDDDNSLGLAATVPLKELRKAQTRDRFGPIRKQLATEAILLVLQGWRSQAAPIGLRCHTPPSEW